MTIGLFLLMLLQGTGAQRTQGKPGIERDFPIGTGIIRGHAYTVNTGMPLKRVEVSLFLKGNKMPRVAFTGRDGAFEFPHLGAGSYTVQCSKKAYLSAGFGSKGPDQPPATISLLDGQTATDKDCRLQHNGSINGTIIDEDGEPLSDVDVSALVRNYRHGQPSYTRVATIRTDDHGHYRLYELPPGRYCLQAWRAPVQSENALAPSFFPNSPQVTDCQWLDLRHGDEASSINLTLRETATHALRGRIIEARYGRAMVGATISLFSEDYGGSEQSARVGINGFFEFPGLIPARYRLDIIAGEMQPPRHWSKIVEVGDADLEVTLNPGIFARVSGQVRPEGGGTIPSGLRVALIPRDSKTPPVEPVSVNGGGAFFFENVSVGDYELALDGKASTPVLLLNDGVSVGDGERFVSTTAVLDFQPAFISGRILDEQGQPFAGAGVVAWNADPEKHLMERFFRTTFADGSGSYRLANLIPGDYFVAIWADYDPGQALEPEVLRRLEGQAVRVIAGRHDNQAGELRATSETRAIPASFVR